MALIVFSGYPSSGKSTRAAQLKADFEERIRSGASGVGGLSEVVVVEDVEYGGRGAFDDSLSEKPSRAHTYTQATRLLSPSRIVILDGLNYIKGFRYQLWCAAREARVRVCTVYVATEGGRCREWNGVEGRGVDGEGKYREETLENLIMRFEEPSSMVRWDSPLFTIAPDDDISQPKPDSASAGVELVAAPEGEGQAGKTGGDAGEDGSAGGASLLDEIWVAVTTGRQKGPTAATETGTKPPPNALQVLTKTTSSILTSLQTHLSLNPSPSPPLPLPTSLTSSSSSSSSKKASSTTTGTRFLIHLPPRPIPPSELQRLKRQFEGIQRRALSNGGTGSKEGGWEEREVGERFGRYLMESWGSLE